jgi:hypothetical protein
VNHAIKQGDRALSPCAQDIARNVRVTVKAL